MTRALPLALALSIVAVPAARLGAQDSTAPGAGRRVRLWAPKPTVGTLIRADSAAFVILKSDGDTLSVPSRTVRWAEISRGLRRRTIDGATVGAGLGSLVGVIVATAVYLPRGCALCIAGEPELMIGGATVGGLVGGIAGALVGSRLRTDRWERLPDRSPRLIAGPASNGVRLGLSAGF